MNNSDSRINLAADGKSPAELCAQLISYSLFSSEKTSGLTFLQLRESLSIFFSDKVIEQARQILVPENDLNGE